MKYVENALAVILMLFCLPVTPAARGQEKVIHSFSANNIDGFAPFENAIIYVKGALYGTTIFGGTSLNQGTVFQLSRVADGGWDEKVIHSFTSGIDGSLPMGTLIADSEGNLYGTTYYGGTTSIGGGQGSGTAFELSRLEDGSWTERVIHSFGSDPHDGINPVGGLTFDEKGNLYGTTQHAAGDLNVQLGLGTGTVFELLPSTEGSWTEKILYHFGSNDTDGLNPQATLAIDSAGNLYGTTVQGGSYSPNDPAHSLGTVFELSPQDDARWTEKILHNFGGKLLGDGASPTSYLTLDAKGNLYGTTGSGGDFSDGVIFELSPDLRGVWTEKVLSYNGDGSAGVASGLTIDARGNLYGTNASGGTGLPSHAGVVFKVALASDGSWREDVVHSFPASAGDGSFPADQEAIAFDSEGNLYGTTNGGGATNFGTVFEIEGVAHAEPVKTGTRLVPDPGAHLVAGEPITLTAVVTPVDGPAIPSGTVTFTDPDGGSITELLVAGRAVYSGVVPPKGRYSVYAEYNGAPGFASSKSATVTKKVRDKVEE